MISTLLWFGLIALFFFMMMRGGCGGHVMGHGHHDHSSDAGRATTPDGAPGSGREIAVDPVCGMQVATATAKTSLYRGTVYYFCSAQHRDAFEANPDAYLTKGVSAAGQQETQSHGC